ncbi:MAG: GNAT family N-acetyltransferase [Pseudomonadota bacterium]
MRQPPTNSSATPPIIQVCVTPVKASTTDLSTLMGDWRALWTTITAAKQGHYNSLAPGFFLSPLWIETWLTHHGLRSGEDLWCIRSYGADDGLRAMGFFCSHRARRHRVLTIRQLVLHATGHAAQDRITTEYNDLLCAPDERAEQWTAILRQLRQSNFPPWDELVLPGITKPSADDLVRAGKHQITATHVIATAPSYHVNLDQLRRNSVDNVEDFIATLSKNSRSQIRRALRLYEKSGPLTLSRTDNVETAQSWFDALNHLHTDKWKTKTDAASLDNPSALPFHRALIEAGIAKGKIDLLRICAGETPVGYLYNFVEGATASFYAGGFRPETDNRLKPGLVCHALATAYYLQRHCSVYDFMGGNDRYKASLGVPGPAIMTVALQTVHPGLALERMARRLKKRFIREPS